MATRVDTAFQELLGRQYLTEEQTRTAESRIAGLRNFFNTNFEMHETAIAMGSYRRGTICRSERDIDLLVPLAPHGRQGYWNRFSNDSFQFLYWVRNALNDHYHATAVSSRRVAVKLDFTVIMAEVVPCFPRTGGGYVMPDGSGGWMDTNPPYHTDFVDRRDRLQLHQLKPLIRLVKFWNIANGSRLRSFHLELLITNMWSQPILQSRPQAVGSTIKALWSWLTESCPDPWPAGGRVDAYLSTYARQQVVNKIVADIPRIDRAEAFVHYGQHDKAFMEWDRVYNGEFPAYG